MQWYTEMLQYLEVILENGRHTFQTERQASIASTNTWFDGVEHFRISPFVFVQSCNLQYNRAHSCRLVHSAFIGGAGEPRGMVIHVADVNHDPGEVAFHRNILIPYLKKSTHCYSPGLPLLSCGLRIKRYRHPFPLKETFRSKRAWPYHDREHVLVDGFMIKLFWSVESAGCRIQAEFLETHRVYAAL